MTTAPPPCRRKALDLLALRPHFRRELERKLLQRGYADDEVTAVLDRLEDEKLLDDRQLAHDWTSRKLEREAVGRRFLAADLGRRGAPSEIVDEVLDELCSSDDVELARDAAASWRRRRPSGTPAALARHLQRRGFSQRAIVTVLDEDRQDGVG